MSHHEGKKKAAAAAEPPMSIDTVIDAPLDKVWKAWSDPELLKQWWGPKTFTAPFIKIDFRVGGKYHYDMRSPEGQDIWSTGTFKEIVPMKRIVATDSFSDEKGNIVSPTEFGLEASIPLEMLLTVTFEESGGKTRMSLRHEGWTGDDKELARQGLVSSIEKLQEALK